MYSEFTRRGAQAAGAGGLAAKNTEELCMVGSKSEPTLFQLSPTMFQTEGAMVRVISGTTMYLMNANAHFAPHIFPFHSIGAFRAVCGLK